MSTNVKLTDIFEGYDSSSPISSGLGNADLERISKNSAVNNESKKENPSVPKNKKDGLILIAKKVETAINALLPKDKKIKLDITFTATIVNSASPGGKKGIFVQNKNNNSAYGNVSMNLNLQRLSKLPALEIYSVMYKALYENAFNIDLENDEVADLGSNLVDKKDSDENKKQKKSPKDKAIECIAGYLNKFLPKYFDGKFKQFDNISKLVATQIVNEMNEDDLNKILSVFFKFEKLDEKAIDLVDQFLGTAEESRGALLLGKASDLMLDPDKEIVALNYMQQYEELLSVSTKNKFKDAMNNGGKSLNDFKDFCVSYANSFMNSNGLKGILVTFEAKGELGTFHDSNPPKINVNLQKIDSISELASTLSHELTHAVDSCVNRTKGNYNREGGGLLNSIGEDIEHSGLKTSDPAFSFLNSLNKYCYRVNPNERHARIGEISALKFMGDMSQDTSMAKRGALQGQLATSIKSFISYQEKTISMLSELNEAKIAEFKSKFASFGKLPKAAHDLIAERIEYLEQNLKSGFNIEAEKESIEAARRIMEEQMREAEKKRNASKAMENNDIYQQREA